MSGIDEQKANAALTKASSNAEEVVTPEELRTILQKPIFNFYYGTAPTGPFHFAYMIPLNKCIDLANLGGKGTMLIADYHAHLDDQKTSFEQMDIRSKYYEESMKGVLGPFAKKFKFVRGSSYQTKQEYVEDIFKLSAKITTTRATRAASEVVRMKDEPKVSELLYPVMQIIDVKFLQADISVGGRDQRNIYMLGREYLEDLGFQKGVYIFMPLLPSLKGGGSKMSASDPMSHIRVTDSVERIKTTMSKAYCPAGILEQNAVTSTVSLIILPRYGKFLVPRKQKFGGDIEFTSVADFEKTYRENKLHPEDVKEAVISKLCEMLEPARKYFGSHPDILAEVERTYGEKRT